MKKTTSLALLPLSAALLLAHQAYALDTDGIQSGAMTIKPVLELRVGNDSNFRNNVAEEDTTTGVIRPSVNFNINTNNVNTDINLAAQYDYFSESTDDNNTDLLIDAESVIEFNARNRLTLTGSSNSEEDVTAIESENDEYRNQSLGLVYTFGAPTATFNIDLGANTSSTASRNSANLDDERDVQGVFGTLYYRISPRTQLLGELRQNAFEYDSNTVLDNTTQTALIGAKWEASAFTTGTLRIGQEEKEFDNRPDTDKDGTVVEFDLLWTPLSYSNVSFTVKQRLEEADEASTTKTDKNYFITWNHDWTDALSTQVEYALTNTRYSFDNRKIDENRFGLGLNYALNRNMDVYLGYRTLDKDATAAEDTYKRDQMFLGLRVGL